VQEEQQTDGDIGDPVERHRRAAAAGQEAGDDDRADERQREVVGKEFGPCHQRFSYLNTPVALHGVFVVKSVKTMIFARARLNWQIHLPDRLIPTAHESNKFSVRTGVQSQQHSGRARVDFTASATVCPAKISSHDWRSETVGQHEKTLT
jgi:hypothetical protein